jgi:hypothetical protein
MRLHVVVVVGLLCQGVSILSWERVKGHAFSAETPVISRTHENSGEFGNEWTRSSGHPSKCRLLPAWLDLYDRMII